ncbi:hypothetical protein YC2023_018037 [Brassica napus]
MKSRSVGDSWRLRVNTSSLVLPFFHGINLLRSNFFFDQHQLPLLLQAQYKSKGNATQSKSFELFKKGKLSNMTHNLISNTKSESVNGTNAGRKSLADDKGPDVPADVPAAVPADASSSEDKAPEPSLVLLDKNQSTVSDLQKEDARYLEKRDAALALCRAKSDLTRKLAASQKSPYTANSTARVIISNRKLYPGYNHFAPIDKTKLKELADWLKSCP